MTNITITISDEHMLKLREIASRFSLTPEELVRITLEELLARPEDALQRALDYVIEKNAELYRRLA